MKYGCLGLLVLLLIMAVVLIGGGTALFFGGSVFMIPKEAKSTYSTVDSYRAREKLLEITLRDSGRSARRDPIVLTDNEVSAFLAGYLESKAIPVSPLLVKLLPNMVEIQGQTVLKHLFKGFPSYFLPDYLPASTMDRQVWVTVQGTIALEGRRGGAGPKLGRLEVSEFRLGNQDVGPWLLWLLLGYERLRWQVPASVEAIKIEDGRLVITAGK